MVDVLAIRRACSHVPLVDAHYHRVSTYGGLSVRWFVGIEHVALEMDGHMHNTPFTPLSVKPSFVVPAMAFKLEEYIGVWRSDIEIKQCV